MQLHDWEIYRGNNLRSSSAMSTAERVSMNSGEQVVILDYMHLSKAYEFNVSLFYMILIMIIIDIRICVTKFILRELR